jgi:hypothetical protein
MMWGNLHFGSSHVPVSLNLGHSYTCLCVQSSPLSHQPNLTKSWQTPASLPTLTCVYGHDEPRLQLGKWTQWGIR